MSADPGEDPKVTIVDQRRRGAYAITHRADLVHPFAKELEGEAWRALQLLGTYTSGNPDGWVLSQRRLAELLSAHQTTVMRWLLSAREWGYLQVFYRFEAKRDGGAIRPGRQYPSMFALRSPMEQYDDGPGDVVMLLVDTPDPRPGQFRVLRRIRNARPPSPLNGRERMLGIPYAEARARGLVRSQRGVWCTSAEEADEHDRRWDKANGRVHELLSSRRDETETELDKDLERVIGWVTSVLDELQESEDRQSRGELPLPLQRRPVVREPDGRVPTLDPPSSGLLAWVEEASGIDPDLIRVWMPEDSTLVNVEDDGSLHITVSNVFYFDWIADNFSQPIADGTGRRVVLRHEDRPTEQPVLLQPSNTVWTRARAEDPAVFLTVYGVLRDQHPDYSFRRRNVGRAYREAVRRRFEEPAPDDGTA
jgi:hypothetical protein